MMAVVIVLGSGSIFLFFGDTSVQDWNEPNDKMVLIDAETQTSSDCEAKLDTSSSGFSLEQYM